MSETKFTRGPWEISKHQDGSSLIVIGPEDWDIARVDYPDRNPNAHLIAAAPELYETLEEVIRISDRKHDAWDKAKAALAKARGEK